MSPTGLISKGDVMRLSLCVALFFLAGDPTTTDKGKTDPPGVPLAALLTSKPASYTLDLGGKTADEVRKQIEAGDYPPPPTVDLSLELRNTGDKDLLIRMGGTTTIIDLDLKGPAAVITALKGPRDESSGRPAEDDYPGAGQESERGDQ